MSHHTAPKAGSPSPRCSRRRAVFLAAVLTAVTGVGCTSQQENQWYFAAAQVPEVHVDTNAGTSTITVDPVKLKFYRVTIKGWSLNGTAELLTGLYPVQPLHELFGEVTRPEEKKTPDPDPKSATPAPQPGDAHAAHGPDAAEAAPGVASGDVALFECDKSLGRLQLIPPDSRFTVFYGVNAEALSDQVKQFSEADDTGALLGRLLLSASGAGEQKVAADAAQAKADDLDKAVGTTLSKTLEDQAGTIKADANDADRKTQLNAALEATAQAMLKALNYDQALDPADAKWADKVTAAVTAMRSTGGAK